MEEIKVHALVLREAPMGDKDKRLVLLTAELGKISVLAKGALGAKSRFKAISGSFSYGEYVLSKGNTFYYIKEGTLLESFYGLRTNLNRLSYAAYMCEAAETFSLEGQENRELLRLLLRGLQAEEKAEKGMESVAADVMVFRMLAENGFYPELGVCRQEGYRDDKKHDLSKPVLFFPGNGNILCAECANASFLNPTGNENASYQGGVWLSSGARAALSYCISQPLSKAFSFKVNEEVRVQIHEAVSRYLQFQTDHVYKSLTFLNRIDGSFT
ncbi:MAG: DNA repair protein RecO [Firmicutes bacterium]|nr:DNA repair protein RecO [Bacillota bacterium]